MILRLDFAGKTTQACFNNLKKNIAEIEKQVLKEGIGGCWGIFGNKGHRYMVLNNHGKLIRRYKKKKSHLKCQNITKRGI